MISHYSHRRGDKYGLGSIAEYNAQWWNTLPTDLRQAALPVYNMSHKDNSLKNLIKKAKEKDLAIPDLAGESKKVPTWYKEGDFKKINQHLKKDVQAVRRLPLTNAIEANNSIRVYNRQRGPKNS